jgi:hypothetical protein
MTIGIIDHKKIDLTADEWKSYHDLVSSYTNLPHSKGEDLFIDLFETDEDGIIVFVKPPSKRHTSLEVFLFIVAIYQHQHVRLMYEQVADICKQMKDKITEIDEKLKKI